MCTCIAEEHAGGGCEAVHVRYLKRSPSDITDQQHKVDGLPAMINMFPAAERRGTGVEDGLYLSASHMTDPVAIILLCSEAQSNAT